jgi:hypothetical protein
MPFLQVGLLRDGVACRTVDRERRMLAGAGLALQQRLLRTEIMSCRKILPRAARITTRTSSSASARPKASFSCTDRVGDWALWVSGRLSQMRAMRPSSSVS